MTFMIPHQTKTHKNMPPRAAQKALVSNPMMVFDLVRPIVVVQT